MMRNNSVPMLFCLVLLRIVFLQQVHGEILALKTMSLSRFIDNLSTAAHDGDEEQYRHLVSTDDYPTARTDNGKSRSSSKGEVLSNQLQEYKGKAESAAWQFYSSPPSEWNSSQWDIFFVIIAGFSVLCCCTAASCAYCFIDQMSEDDYDGDLMKKSRKRRMRILRRRHRAMLERREANADDRSSLQGTVDARSISTINSEQSKGSLEIEDEKDKLFVQQSSPIKNISLVKSFEQVMTRKKIVSVENTDEQACSAKSEPLPYARMMV